MHGACFRNRPGTALSYLQLALQRASRAPTMPRCFSLGLQHPGAKRSVARSGAPVQGGTQKQSETAVHPHRRVGLLSCHGLIQNAVAPWPNSSTKNCRSERAPQPLHIWGIFDRENNVVWCFWVKGYEPKPTLLAMLPNRCHQGELHLVLLSIPFTLKKPKRNANWEPLDLDYLATTRDGPHSKPVAGMLEPLLQPTEAAHGSRIKKTCRDQKKT